MIIIDTNIISEVMRPIPDEGVKEWLDSLNRSDVGITAITVAELLYGIGSLPEGHRKMRLLDAAAAVFDDFFQGRIFAFDKYAAALYADIGINRERAGRPISMPDAQIAAICQANGARLATRNTKDFEHIDLALYNPWVDLS